MQVCKVNVTSLSHVPKIEGLGKGSTWRKAHPCWYRSVWWAWYKDRPCLCAQLHPLRAPPSSAALSHTCVPQAIPCDSVCKCTLMHLHSWDHCHNADIVWCWCIVMYVKEGAYVNILTEEKALYNYLFSFWKFKSSDFSKKVWTIQLGL